MSDEPNTTPTAPEPFRDVKRTWGGEVKNVAVLVAVGVNADGHREMLGVVEGGKEDAASWLAFLRHLKARGLTGVRLVTSDKRLGLVGAVGECFPEAQWQRCVVHFYRNVFTAVPSGWVRLVFDTCLTQLPLC